MLSLFSGTTRSGSGVSRRCFLHAGGLTAFGMGLDACLQSRSLAATTGAASMDAAFGKAKACIVLFMLGGPPQHETWDPKPDAPIEIRGGLGVIPTATPGLQVGELMPQTARMTQHIAVLRAMATDDNAHSSSGYWMLTGHPHAPKNAENVTPGSPNDIPCVASVVRHLKGDRTSIPGAVRLPDEIWNEGKLLWPGQDAGWLGPTADPWLVKCEPQRNDFRIPAIALPADIGSDRLLERRRLQHAMNAAYAGLESSATSLRYSIWQRRAMDLLQADEAQRAFELHREPDSVRDRYGRHRFGQSVLLARRLVEAGVSLVQVNWTREENYNASAPAWDTHVDNEKNLKSILMPTMDQAYSALIEDLSLRGMLDETLIVWMGEFGRSPRINPSAGRDHWGHVFSVALAGGGVRGGVVHGRSDRHAAFPIEGRVEPQDLTATIYHCLGISPETALQDRLNRPIAISKGAPISAIL